MVYIVCQQTVILWDDEPGVQGVEDLIEAHLDQEAAIAALDRWALEIGAAHYPGGPEHGYRFADEDNACVYYRYLREVRLVK